MSVRRVSPCHGYRCSGGRETHRRSRGSLVRGSLLALSSAVIALFASHTPVFASFGGPAPGTPDRTAFLSDSGRQASITGEIDCSPQAGTPWRVRVHLVQGSVTADGTTRGTCGGNGSTWSVELTPAGGTSFRSGSASYVAVYSAGSPHTDIENITGTIALWCWRSASSSSSSLVPSSPGRSRDGGPPDHVPATSSRVRVRVARLLYSIAIRRR